MQRGGGGTFLAAKSSGIIVTAAGLADAPVGALFGDAVGLGTTD
jgi:hypothetical protein